MSIIFPILSYAIDAGLNYVDKFLLSKYNLHPTVITIYSGLFAFLVSIIILIFTGLSPIDSKSLLIILASGIFSEFILLAYFKALALDDASYVVPFFQLVPVFTLILSFILLGERLTLKQHFGSAIIIISGFILALDKTQTGVFQLRPASYWMLLAAFFSAIGIVLFKLGITEINFWHALPYNGLGIALGAALILLYKGNLELVRNKTKHLSKKVFLFLSVEETIVISSRYLRFFAVTLIPASLVSLLIGFQPLFALSYGLLLSAIAPRLIREEVSKKIVALKLFSTLCMFLGLHILYAA